MDMTPFQFKIDNPIIFIITRTLASPYCEIELVRLLFYHLNNAHFSSFDLLCYNEKRSALQRHKYISTLSEYSF